MSAIIIHGAALPGAPPLLASGIAPAAGINAPEYALLKWHQPLTPGQRTSLRSVVDLLEVVQGHAYIVKLLRSRAEVIQAIQGLPVSLVPYAPELRVGHTRSVLATRALRGRLVPLKVDIVAQRGADISFLLNAPALRGHKLRATASGLRGSIPETALRFLGTVSQVRHVGLEPEYETASGIATVKVMHTQAPVAARFDGAGETIVVCDTGFCSGTLVDVHPAFAGRVRNVYHVFGEDAADLRNGHGTAVASCALGAPSGNAPGFGGTAPGAQLIALSITDHSVNQPRVPDDVNRMFDVHRDGATPHIFNMSFVLTTNEQQLYGPVSADIDRRVQTHRQTVVCVAAGNDGEIDLTDQASPLALKSIGAPATGKNVVSVGASENLRASIQQLYKALGPQFDVPPFQGNKMADDIDDVMLHGSRGPTADGRVKPDVLAPGTSLLVASASAQGESVWGSDPPDGYHYVGGTSMSTGLVSGACAVIREWLREDHARTAPSAALVKAILVAGAEPLQGVPGSSVDVPDSIQGFGRVDLARSLAIQVAAIHDEATAIDTGDEEVFTFELSEPSLLTVALVWTDDAGSALANDLDLIVEAGGAARFGNKKPGDQVPDTINNVERVRWVDAPAGPVTVRVRGAHCAMSAQTYALVWLIENP